MERMAQEIKYKVCDWFKKRAITKNCKRKKCTYLRSTVFVLYILVVLYSIVIMTYECTVLIFTKFEYKLARGNKISDMPCTVYEYKVSK